MIHPSNDYEVIARIKEGDDQALEHLASNYSSFIAKKIHSYSLAYMFDDLFQEGLILLYKSVLNFEEKFNKTFTRYFEMNFERLMRGHINRMVRRREITYRNKTYIAEANHCVRENSVYYEIHLQEIKKVLTEFEFSVYILRVLKCTPTNDIASRYHCETKSIYNAVHRAKLKIHAYFEG